MNKTNKFIAGILAATMITGCAAQTQTPETQVQNETTETASTENTETTASVQDSDRVSKVTFTPGTYDVTASGRNGDVVLHVSFDENHITDITTENSETVGLGTDAIDFLIATTLDTQNIPTDGVSGATISSGAYLEALKEAVEMAGGNPAELTATDTAVKEKQEYITEADIIVVGAGAAGMTAAVTASNMGAKVIVLEKNSIAGGNTPAAANGTNAADSKIQLADEAYKAANASVEGLENLQLQNEDARKNLVKVFAENSGEVIDWMNDELGVEFEVDIQEDDRNPVQNYYMLSAVSEATTGATMTNAVKNALEKTDAEFYLSMEAYELITNDDGKVTGVMARNSEGEEIEFTGKAVLLATGGFGKNSDLLAQVSPRLANATTDEIAPTTGDGLIMAQAIGAKAVNLDQIQTFPVVIEGYGMVTPNKLPGGFGVDAVIVNDSAERFTAEGFEIVDAILAQPEGNAYMIFDENALNDELKQLISSGFVQEASDAKELGEKLGLDGDTLQKTVDAYNEDVLDGTDDQFGKKDAATLEGNLYGFKYGVGAHYFMGGVLINENTQVLDEDENPIEGLYAAGEVTGGFHGTQRIDGSGIGDSFTFGRIAGRTMAKTVKEN